MSVKVCELHLIIISDKCSLSNCSQHHDATQLSRAQQRTSSYACGSRNQRKRNFQRMGNLLSQAFFSQTNKKDIITPSPKARLIWQNCA